MKLDKAWSLNCFLNPKNKAASILFCIASILILIYLIVLRSLDTRWYSVFRFLVAFSRLDLRVLVTSTILLQISTASFSTSCAIEEILNRQYLSFSQLHNVEKFI